MNEWMNEWMSEWVNEWMACLGGHDCGGMYKWMNEWMVCLGGHDCGGVPPLQLWGGRRGPGPDPRGQARHTSTRSRLV